MVLNASKLLEQEGLTPWTRFILDQITVLDSHGAWEWNLRVVALVTVVVLSVVRFFFKKKRGVDWYALLHALVSASGSLACVYLDLVASEALTGTPEPLRSCQCQGPLTSLHRILPAITMGYSIFDLIDGFFISPDFAAHGLATFFLMAFYCEHDNPHFITPMLLMEASTPFLTVVRADFFSPQVSMINQGLFAISFLLFRLVAAPLIWLKLMVVMYKENLTSEYHECFPIYFLPVAFIFGIFFHLLNGYWFVKIIKKARRKMLGQESVTANNDVYNQKDESTTLSNNKGKSKANGYAKKVD